jgi:hypothetical protein
VTPSNQAFVRRPAFYCSAVVVGVALVVGALVLVHHLNEPETLSEKLGALMLQTAHHSCLNGKASHERLTATERPDLYPDLLPRVRSAEIVACEYGGEVSIVLHFKDRRALRRALSRSRSAKTSGWCVVDASAFDGALFDRASSLRRYCARLHGTVRSGPYQLSQTG